MKNKILIFILLVLGCEAQSQQAIPISNNVGDACYGGVLFKIENTRGILYGLIAAPNDQASMVSWGRNGITGASSASDGQYNSRKILDYASWLSEDHYFAVQTCNECRIGGFDDWYLPSIDELTRVYEQRNLIGGFLLGDYCSSTEMGSKDAYSIHFRPAHRTVYYYNKVDKIYNIRCIRKQQLSVSVEKPAFSLNDIQHYLSTSPLDEIEGIYSANQTNGQLFYKIAIVKDSTWFKGIVVESTSPNWHSGDIKAVFEPSSISGVYSVKWFMEDMKSFHTFCKMESSNLLLIEFNGPQGDLTQVKLVKMYPIDQDNSQVSRSIEKSSGSGFFISKDGLVATNAHVVGSGKKFEIFVFTEKGSFSYPAQVLLIDKNNDVAILKIIGESFFDFNNIPYGISDKVSVGEHVFTIGYPLTDYMGVNYKMTDGVISSLTGSKDAVGYYQISVPLQPGNSGGPLFNEEGNIIGLTAARLNPKLVGTDIEQVNYAVKSTFLINLINLLPESVNLPQSSSLQRMEMKEQIKVLKNYVCLIKVY
jgi:S1-C subfamily serine protease